ncbi:NADH dehydrogenase [Capsicum chacoense]
MSGITSASFLARRAAQRERVRILYRRALRDTLNWAVHRHLFYPDADALRERFEANRKVEDIETIDRLIADGEASYNKWRHPDPYIGMFLYEFRNKQHLCLNSKQVEVYYMNPHCLCILYEFFCYQ